MREPASFETSWKLRRRVIFGTLGFCAVVVLFLTFRGEDTRLHETIASGLIFLAGFQTEDAAREYGRRVGWCV